MSKRKLGIGIVGCGMISYFHARAIAEIEEAQLVGAHSDRAEAAERFANEFDTRIFHSFEDMLACPDVDIVSICTPSGLHAPMAVKAAKAGKHIIVEKPVAITREQIDSIEKATKESRVKLAVISQHRFSPAVQFVKKAIDEGAFGKILIVDINMKYYRTPEYYKSSAWRGTREMDGGGALMNQGIHGIDLINYLAGPVSSVYGKVKTEVHDIEVEDTAVAFVEYESGAIGAIHGTTSVNPGQPRVIDINGTLGSVTLIEDKIKRWNVEGYDMPAELLFTPEKGLKGGFNAPDNISYKNHKKQIRDMIGAIIEDREPMITLSDGRRSVETILSIYESSETGTPIKLKKI